MAEGRVVLIRKIFYLMLPVPLEIVPVHAAQNLELSDRRAIGDLIHGKARVPQMLLKGGALRRHSGEHKATIQLHAGQTRHSA